jgi:formylglycine-generating enzyme required for sulfatase activity
MVRVPKVGLKQGDWHHVVITWENFDTGRKDARAALYIDGKLIGEVKDREIAMKWEPEKAGIYVAVNYIGLLDELALFGRSLTAAEVKLLHGKPGLLQPLKAKKEERPGREQVEALRRRLEAVGPGEREALRRDMLAFLPGDAGRANAEEVLALLRRLGQRGPAPEAPRFPFDAAAARRYQADYADRLGLPLEFTNRLGMTFVLIPPGTFLMGSPPDEPGRAADEGSHAVTLTRPFYLSKFETTNGQFARFVAAEGFVTDVEKNGGGNAHDALAVWQHRPGTNWLRPGYAGPFERTDAHPVVHVSHADAVAFCAWLSRSAPRGVAYGLPTEAQWEWACRAGAADRFWWGPEEDTSGKVANVGDRALKRVHPQWPRAVMAMDDGHAFAAPVGSYRPNAFGLHDMLGNVWELCGTRSGPYPQGAATDPGDLDVKRGFAVRGGGWSNVAADCRCATRQADPPHFGHSNLGFRVALPVP